jgi:psp operon transcriptional activator
MEHSSGGLIGESPAFMDCLEQVSQVAALGKPVLILGERGTGKELIAERLNFLSPRWEAPFVKVNCAGLTESLLETELFGHEAGAFTGAVRRHIGRFERAEGGTLFLDELATISSRMQEKILRVIEYGEFERVGGDRTLRADVRVIAATNENLPELARAGRFRADLLDRLAFDVVHLPPLRARPEDILLLAEHFALGITGELGRTIFPGFSEHARRRLLAHDWPGNIRELKNAVERSIYRHKEIEAPVDEIVVDPFDSPWSPDRQDGRSLPEGAVADRPQPAAETLPHDLNARLAELEAAWLKQALQRCRHNQRRAAELLGLSYDQFRARLRKHGLGGTRVPANQRRQ